MKRIIVKGFGYSVILLIMLGVCLSPVMVIENIQESETADEVPLQQAVGYEKAKVVKKTTKKKTTKKKKIKIVKRKAKKYVKAKVRKTTTKKVNTTAYQNYAHDLVINKYGWSEYDFQCLVKLWNRESGWNPLAENKKSKARGIPQSLPARKMASEGSDYMTNGYTQIRWGLKYIKGRYGSPSRAWQHSQKKGWY